jgi:peptide/nickel transport system substrate-binding protein
MGKAINNGLRLAAVASAGALLLAACGGGSSESSSGAASGAASGGTESGAAAADGGQKGGTIYLLQNAEQWLHVDPQRMYTGSDISFFTGYTTRTLTAYVMAAGEAGTELTSDLATDTGTANEDATSWSFTIRDGASFEDGTPVTCEDVKYGVSRTFATDVITDGPTYAISYLDIPKADDGSSVYKGPYNTDASNDTAAYDAAVTCSDDNKTITFNLAKPVADFNYTVTLPAFSPVPQASDTGESYDDSVVSTGPYKISEYTKGQKMTLVRNENWDPASDDYHPAYPDQVEVQFAQDPAAIDQRLIADAGDDQTATEFALQPENLATVFSGDPRFEGRSYNDFDPYVRYTAINTQLVPNVKQRQAIVACMNNAEYIAARGGDFAGDVADGVVKPTLPLDYAPTGLWDGMYGEPIPAEGNPELGKKLIEESGEPMKTLTYQFPQNPVDEKIAASMKAAMERCGITVNLEPIEPGQYYGIVLDPAQAKELMRSGWGPDWLNASTVIPELFGETGGFNLSQVVDDDFNAKVQAALATLDRTEQGKQWQELNKYAMEQAWAIPHLFSKGQAITGSKIGNVYLWYAWGYLAFGDLYVKS